ncbi:MAG: DedA family protein [Gemmatimonadota bacterium]
MDGLIGWLSQLPLGALYLILATVAAVENVFPPLPADTVVVLGSWLAARGQGNVIAAFASTWIGNVAGASAMYFVARRHGAGWMHRRFPGLTGADSEARMKRWYARYGVAALFICRFIPGVRAVVPVFAGALRAPPVLSIGAMAVASAIWYGLISYLGFTAGSDWNAVLDVIRRYGRIAALAGVGILVVGIAVWFARRRRTRS